MTPTSPGLADASARARPALQGMARLLTMAFEGQDLMPVAQALIARASADARDAEALLDLSVILELQGLKELALATQAQALRQQRLFELPARDAVTLRLLAVMAPGDLMTNMPLPFLVEDSGVALTLLYLVPGEPLPTLLPPHDLALIAVSQSDATAPLLGQLEASLPCWPRRVLNHPGRVLLTSREQAWACLRGIAGLCMPASVRVERAALQALALGERVVDALPPEGDWPLIVRPVDSHAGHGLARVDSPVELGVYLEGLPAPAFYLSRFIDYAGADGQFRKYRIVIIDGEPYAGHMAISAHWMIHYLNAGMTDSAAKRAEEAAFMAGFDEGFGRRHGPALRALACRVGLEYLVIDCAETRQGELLVFEVDPGAVVHAMDPGTLFPYKLPQMRKVFDAFGAMLARAVARA